MSYTLEGKYLHKVELSVILCMVDTIFSMKIHVITVDAV